VENFIYPLIGGVIIGIATSIMLYFNGRITGISGIVSNTLKRFTTSNDWRYLFILGLISGGFIAQYLTPGFFNYSLDSTLTETILAGLLVGYGASLGSGCTSGHGVCGLPRFSKRSLAATLTFMTIAIITVSLKGAL